MSLQYPRQIPPRLCDAQVFAALAKLKEAIRDHDDGLAIGPSNYTVADAAKNWLGRHRQPDRSPGRPVGNPDAE